MSGERIVVVSPHLDDGVLSLGAAMASWAMAGAQVALLTVLACDPESDAPAGGWDSRGGFSSEGEAACARMEEDRRACAILGVSPVWLPFGSVDYDRHGDEREILEAIAPHIEGVDLVLLPGFPLSHPDHAWLVGAVVQGQVATGRLVLYAEQPYTRRAGSPPVLPPWLEDELDPPASFEDISLSRRNQLAKWRAIRRYRSQLPLLGMRRSLRKGPHVYAFGKEAMAGIDDRLSRTPH